MLARDHDSGVRAAILSATSGTVGLEPEWAQLVARLADDPDPEVRRRVALKVRHLAPDAARDILTRYATDRDQRVRQVASTGLNQMAGRGASRRGHVACQVWKRASSVGFVHERVAAPRRCRERIRMCLCADLSTCPSGMSPSGLGSS
jgi:HEAT repeat protein